MPDYGAYRFTRVAGATPDAPDVYSPIQEGWVSSGARPSDAAELGGAASTDAGLCQGRHLRRADPRRACGEQSGAPGARPRIRDPIGRPDVSRAGSRSRLVRRRPQEPRARARRAVAVRGRRVGGLSAGRSARAVQAGAASTLTSPISAAASAGAIIRRCRSTSRWRRCSFPAARSASRTTATSSSRPASSVTRSRCTRRIGIDRATGKINAFAADHVLDGGGLANFSANVATVGATAAIGIYDVPKVDVTTVALHSRGVTAGSMRGYGTLQTMTALEVLIDEAASALKLDPIDFRRRNALKPGGRTMTGNPYSVSVRTRGDSRQARKASDLAAARQREGARTAGRDRRRHRRRLRHQGLRHRRGLLAGPGRDRSGWPHRHPWRSRRDGQRHRHGARQPGGGSPGRRGRRSLGRAGRHLRRARARHLRRPLHDGPGDPGRRAAQSALGAGDQLGHQRLDRRPCRHAGGGRGRARHLPLRIVAGGARAVGHPVDRSAGQAMGDGALARTGS